MLTARDIEIVRDDWEKVELIADEAATLLYDRLFALDRNLRLLFPLDLQEQRLKLIRMLGVAIYGLSDPDVLRADPSYPRAQALRARRARPGLRDPRRGAELDTPRVWPGVRRGA